MRSQGSASHLIDVDLIRYIDAEGDADERRNWDLHVAGCRTCRDAASSLRRDSETVARWLAAADFENAAPPLKPAPELRRPQPVPATGGSQGRSGRRRIWRGPVGGGQWLKAAAITLLLAAPLAAVPAVRGWVAAGVALIRTDGPVLTPTVDPIHRDASAVIRFVPAAGTFSVTLDGVPGGGTLHVDRSLGPEALLEVTGESPASSPVVAARSLRIANATGGTASYRLSLPAQVDGVLLDVGGQQQRLDAASLDRSITIVLTWPVDGR